MPIAAVPSYLGQNFTDASPGMRFGMYLKLWGIDHRGQDKQERLVKLENKVLALKEATQLTKRDSDIMHALLARQSAAFAASGAAPALLRLDALAVAPFTTGLGNEHPLENSFAFLNPYGLPYLPGSGVKGVLRQAARELANGLWGATQGWSGDQIDVLFGRESANGDSDHLRGALSFWDVIPQVKGNHLAVEIMTPHQSHYYQQKRDGKSGDSMSPHDSGAPTPISFLTVPAGSALAFHVHCDLAHLARLAPDLAQAERWKTLLGAAFEHAFEWLGFGAKTSVGYGAMQFDEKARQRAEAERAERLAQEAEATRLAGMSANQQLIDAFSSQCAERAEQLKGNRENPNGKIHADARALAKAAHEGADWSAEDKKAAADAIEAWLPKLVRVEIKDERKKLKLALLRGG